MKEIFITIIMFVYKTICVCMSILAIILLFYIYINKNKYNKTLQIPNSNINAKLNIKNSIVKPVHWLNLIENKHTILKDTLEIEKTKLAQSEIHLELQLSITKYYDARVQQKTKLSYRNWRISESKRLLENNN